VFRVQNEPAVGTSEPTVWIGCKGGIKFVRRLNTHTIFSRSILRNRSDFSDEELLALLIEGDKSAFETLYRVYFRKIYAYALNFVKSTELAEDIAQDVFIKVWENRASMRGVRSFKAFIFTICKNATLTLLSRAARETRIKDLILSGANRFYFDAEQHSHTTEYRELLEKAILQLPPKRQQIFRLCKLEGKSYDEVAEKLQISPGTINDHIVKATRQIRAFFSLHR